MISGFLNIFGIFLSSPSLSGFLVLVYEYSVPYIHTDKVVDVTMIFDVSDSHFIEAKEYNKDNNAVKYDLDFGEHLIFHLQCGDDQCILDINEIGVYENKMKEVYIEHLDHYSTTLGRFNISMIPTTKWAPVILRDFMRYMRPFDIPDEFYSPQDICHVIEQIAKFFNGYFNEDD